MEKVCLIIKAPSSKHEDFKIDCQLSWTILDLKIHICNEYPSKPNISDQRLIYSGHLLKDEQSLRDIIQSSDDNNDTYTFHLVCSQRPASHGDSGNKATSASTGSSPATTMQPNAPSTVAPPSLNDTPLSAAQNPALNPFLGGTGNLADMQESYNAMMQQYYQYMSYYYLSSPPAAVPDYASYYAFASAYMRAMNPSGTGPINPIAGSNTNPNNNQIPVNNLNGQANGPAVAANAANRNANNNNANNQADRENRDNEDNRDWTEMLYSFSKAMVMFSIMYFYSSFGRLLLLLTIAIFLYLYKTARLPGVQNILNNANLNNNNNNNNNNPVNERPLNNNNEDANNNGETEAQVSPEDGNSNAPEAAVPDNSGYSGLRLVWVFVTSLFTSLIPDPTPIN